ncbi:tensin isoform X2 [Nematostella vectensis]|uniref:tensin isoform X2 n=1 Tax=Nematostella vectensis TaxID=45351 RepID=UPI0020771E85|nr:tensin isoform X2 [Nematostella vectensis]
MSQASKATSDRLEGFICPACLVDFPSAAKVQDHWSSFHSSKEGQSSEDGRDNDEVPGIGPPQLTEVKNGGKQTPHVFKSGVFQLPERCRVCSETISNEGSYCEGCGHICHKKCESMVKTKCPNVTAISTNPNYKTPKGIFKHLQHIVSKGRVRHVDHEFDLDLTYITERIIAMSFPGTGLESTYRNNLRDVAKMLQRKHQDKYMVFNLSERRYDISKLNHQVLDFGWPDHLAPPLERLCSIIKSIDSWLKTDPQHVVVVHCKGGKGRTGVVISAYMHFSKMCSSPEAALDWFAIKRFYDDKLGGVTQPSQRRYVHYFSDYLEGKIKLSSEPMFLHHVIVHGIPNFDSKGGCKPFLRVYDGLKLVYTSGVFLVTQDMERVCITIEGGLILHGDVLIKCYHKNTLSSVRDIIFRCQFHTGAIKDCVLVLDKTDLDEAHRDKRFPDNCKVEFVFSATGSFVAEIKDDVRLQSIIRHSLQPVENPDTVLMYTSKEECMEDEWPSEGLDDTLPDLENLNSTGKPDFTTRTTSNTRSRNPAAGAPAYVAGPVDGSLYAQVDKNLKKHIRSHSLDSGIQTAADPYERRAQTLNYKSRNAVRVQYQPRQTATLNRLQFQSNTRSDKNAMETDLGGKIQSIDKLLRELGECSDLLDTTIMSGKKASERPEQSPTALEEISIAQMATRQENARGKAYPPTPLRRHASYDATEKYQVVPYKLARTTFSGGDVQNGITPSYRQRQENGGVPGAPQNTSSPKIALQKTPSTKVTPPSPTHISPKYYATQVTSSTPLVQPGQTVEVNFMNGVGNIRQAKIPADINNNPDDEIDPDAANFSFRDPEPEPEFTPEKGNVAAKVAFLSEIVFPGSPPLHPPRKGTVPMPGLVSKSPSEVSEEISKYNATSLAPAFPPPPPPLAETNEFDEGISSKADTDDTPRSAPSSNSEANVDITSDRPQAQEFAPIHLTIAPVQEAEVEAKVVVRGPRISNLIDKMKEDEEDGYAELEEVQRPVGRKVDGTGHVSRPSPLVISEGIPSSQTAEVSSEPTRGPGPLEAHAIDGIMSEMADISIQSEASLSHETPSTPQTPRSPTSSMSGPFDNAFGRKRSPYHSDKGYSSNTSLSSESSEDVFLDLRTVPGLKFDKDNSEFWYKPKITRDQAINVLKDKEPGLFVVRDSQSFPGAYGLAVKVAIPPPHVLQGDLTKVDLANEKIRHFLIESTKKGVKLKGCDNEPVFGSLAAFVFQHTITPLSLPLRLVIPNEDLMPDQDDKPDGPHLPLSPTQETMKVMFVGESNVEMLSGSTAVQRTVEDLLKYKATPRFTPASFKVTREGVTITDLERKVFFRKHFPMTSILHCGIDPLDQRWDLHLPDYTGKSRTFGMVVRRIGEAGNDCHLFAEVDDDHSVNTVINLVNKYISNPS